MKFKVGQQVRVRKDLKINSWYGGYRFTDEMGKYLGLTLTVSHVSDVSECYNLDGLTFRWTDEMLEPVETFNIGDVVYDNNGDKAVIKRLFYELEYEDGHYFKKAHETLTNKKPLIKITKEQLAEMGYEVKE